MRFQLNSRLSDSGRLTIALALSLLLHVLLMVYVRFAQPSAPKPPSLTTLNVTLAKKPAEMPVTEKPAVVAEAVAPPQIPLATRKSAGKAKIGVQSAKPVISSEPVKIAPKPKRKPKIKRKGKPIPKPRKETILATNKPSELTVAKALTEAPPPKPPQVPEEPVKPAEPPPSVDNPVAGTLPPAKHPTKIVAVAPPPEEKPLPVPEPEAKVEEPKPVEIEKPKPVKVEEPKPVVIEKPIVIEEAKPIVIEEPKPVKIEEPAKIEEPKPVKIEEPLKIEEPKPVKIEEPVVIEEPKPVKIEEPKPVKIEQPVVVEEPIKVEEPKPVVIEEPVVVAEPKPLKIEQPPSIFAAKSNSVFSAGKQDSGAARSSVFSKPGQSEWDTGSSHGLPRITALKPPPGARRKVVGSKEQELRYITYRDSVILKLQRVGQFNYPADAARNNQGGSLVLEFAIKPDGSVEEISITRPSPIASLNKGAEKIVRLCSPFSPLPENIKRDTDILIVRVNWTFTNLRQQFD